jgi:hypothetical protein
MTFADFPGARTACTCPSCGRVPAETEEIAMVTVGLLLTLEAKWSRP